MHVKKSTGSVYRLVRSHIMIISGFWVETYINPNTQLKPLRRNCWKHFFLLHLLIAGCGIGVQLSVRQSVPLFVRPSNTFFNLFEITAYAKELYGKLRECHNKIT